MRSVLAGAAAVAAFALLVPPAAANGVDLSRYQARPGEEVAVTGHFWLSPCCPSRAYEHVRLSLLNGDERIELFDEPADRFGTVYASFTVPEVPPGVYRLQACGENESGSGSQADCRPGSAFQVLAGGTGGGGGGSALVIALALVAVLAFAGSAAAVVLAMRRRR